jgi:hypothetical protein
MTYRNIVFKQPIDDLVYDPPEKIRSFYQLCYFENPVTKKYYVRQFKLNQNGEIISVMTKGFNKKKYDKLLDNLSQNQYKSYSTYDFKTINYPSADDVMKALSNVFETNCDYNGYAPF